MKNTVNLFMSKEATTISTDAKSLPKSETGKFRFGARITKEYTPPINAPISSLPVFDVNLISDFVSRSSRYVIKKFSTKSTSTYIVKTNPHY